MVRGRCLCGGVAWQASGPLELMSHCHCSMCRKAHGAAFATYVAAREEHFRWLRGREHVARYESSPGFLRTFCSRCGSVVAGDPADGRVFMPAGCLEDAGAARPLAHIFVASKAPWHEIADALPRFDAYPPEADLPALPSQSRPESGDGVIRGSCLCNGVAYEIEAEIPVIVNCHCSRCRRARSAAHASNLFAEVARFRWTRGEALLEAYKVPDAERFTSCFCRVCGSSLPRVSPEQARVVVPAGTIDGDPGARERLHIFCGSKAPWYEIPDDLPQFDEYPPGAES
jgi:hypothetical protein